MQLKERRFPLYKLEKEIIHGDDISRRRIKHGFSSTSQHGRRLNRVLEEFPRDEDGRTRIAQLR